MDALPVEVFGLVLEHVCSLNDLGALWQVNRQMALYCGNIRAKTLWRITYRTCWRDCPRHDGMEEDTGSPCNCSVVEPALYDFTSAAFKVRAWLYRRASERSFGRSEEALGRCVIRMDEDLENPYDKEGPNGGGKLVAWPEGSDDWDDDEWQRYADEQDEQVREWAKVWQIFKRHLVMQRVQRVNQGDPTAMRHWKRSYGADGKEREWRLV